MDADVKSKMPLLQLGSEFKILDTQKNKITPFFLKCEVHYTPGLESINKNIKITKTDKRESTTWTLANVSKEQR